MKFPSLSKRLIKTWFLLLLAATIQSSPSLVQAQVASNYIPVKIGLALPLSGPLSEYGVAARNGVDLARSDSPELFTNLSFIVEDHLYDNRSAIAACSKLLELDKVDLLYLWGYGPVQVVVPLAERNKFPLIAVSAEGTVTVGRDYSIRFNFHANQLGETLLRYLRSQGFRRLAVIKIEQAFLNGILQGLETHLNQDERLEVIGIHDSQDSDFRSSIAKLKAKSYDAVGVLLPSGQISQFYRQAAQLKLTLPSFGTHYFESHSEIQQAQGHMQGAVFATIGVSDAFREKYIAQFGNDSRITFAGAAYDIAILAGRILNRLRVRPSAIQLLDLFRTTEAQHGVTGIYRYVNNSQVGPSFEFTPIVRRVERNGFSTLHLEGSLVRHSE